MESAGPPRVKIIAAVELTREVDRLRITITTVVVLALLLVVTAPSMAQQRVTNTWIGTTGLVIIPTADTAGGQELIASFNWIDTEHDSTIIGSGIFGLTPQFELGVAIVDAGDDSEGIINLKYNVNLPRLINNPRAPDLAIGVWDLGDQLDQAIYLALSNDFAGPTNARWTLGVAGSDGGSLDGLLAGVEFAVVPQGTIQVDYDGDDVNAAYRHRVSDQFSLGVGIIDGDLALNAALYADF